MKRGNRFLFSILFMFAVSAITAGPRAVYAEETPSGENTDGGSISLNLVHHQAQSLTLQLNTDHLAHQDVTLNCMDATTGEPLSISLLASPGSSEYTLYDLETPVEELTGTLSISMITEPGYKLNLADTSFTIDGQTYSDGETVTIHSSRSSVSSSVTCQEMTVPETPMEPETPAEPEAPVEPETPAEPEIPAEPETPAEPEAPAEPETPVQPETPAQPATPVESETSTVPEGTVTETFPASETSGLPTEALEDRGIQAPEPLTTTPITENQTAAVPNIETAVPNAGNHAAESYPAGNGLAEGASKPAGSVLAPAAETTKQTSRIHVSEIVRKVNLVLAVLSLIVLILLLTKLILTLIRERKSRRFRRSR